MYTLEEFLDFKRVLEVWGLFACIMDPVLGFWRSPRLNFWSFDALAKIDDREVANAKIRVLANSDSLEAEKK